MEKYELEKALSTYIISTSGWRSVFDCEGIQGRSGKIDKVKACIAFLASVNYETFLLKKNYSSVIIAQDTRPTGKILSHIAHFAFKTVKTKILGFSCAPEVMAYAMVSHTPFIYFSASHNPIGDNGIKFGLDNGGVLQADDAYELIEDFRMLTSSIDLKNDRRIKDFFAFWDELNRHELQDLYDKYEKEQAQNAYFDFTLQTISAQSDKNGKETFCKNFVDAIIAYKNTHTDFCIVCDYNGSSRVHSIDKHFFENFHIPFVSFNEKNIVHEIIPEGKNLEPLSQKMQEYALVTKEKQPLFGFMPDCDGDRGNLVFYDPVHKKTLLLPAQEVFALCVLSELSFIATMQGKEHTNKTATERKSDPTLAVVVNCATSLRIHDIAKAFNAKVFTAEVGEANVVSLADSLRAKGYTVRILGEGSNGGNITHPSRVRDPLNTIASILKLLMFRETKTNTYAPFKQWCMYSGNEKSYKQDFSIHDIISTLPKYVTTETQSENAILHIKQSNQVLLKKTYQKVFEQEWTEKKEELDKKYGIKSFKAFATKGIQEFDCTEDFSLSETGGLKIMLFNGFDTPIAFLWMRGSKTEPLFRILVDVKGDDTSIEIKLLVWQRSMLEKADKLSFDECIEIAPLS